MNWASVWWGFWQHAVTYTFLSNWCVDTRWPCLSGHPIKKNTFVYLYLSRWFWASTPRSATEISTNHISDASWQEPPAHSAKKLLHCNSQFSSILGISFIHLQMYFFTMNKKCVSKLFTGSVFYPPVCSPSCITPPGWRCCYLSATPTLLLRLITQGL